MTSINPRCGLVPGAPIVVARRSPEHRAHPSRRTASARQQNDVKSKDNQDKNVNKNQTLSEKVNSKKPNSTNTENLKPSEKVVDSKQIQSDSTHTNGHDGKIDQNSVKLENQETYKTFPKTPLWLQSQTAIRTTARSLS